MFRSAGRALFISPSQNFADGSGLKLSVTIPDRERSPKAPVSVIKCFRGKWLNITDQN